MMDFHLLLIGFVFIYSVNISLSQNIHWDYRGLGPDVWGDLFPQCAGQSQSPINIKTECTVYQSFAPFQFSAGYDLVLNFTLVNNGHTVVATPLNSSALPLTLTGGGLGETFIFNSFHLHWGENYNSGSEHQLNGKKYAGEIHFVHLNAAGSRAAVLGMFMQSNAVLDTNSSESEQHRRKRHRIKREVNNTDNTTELAWDEYFHVAGNLNVTNATTVHSFKISSLVGTRSNKYYRYSGSLTTPPCSQIVTWTVYQDPIQFTDVQLSHFRSHLFFEDYRGPQPLYNRTVYRNFPDAVPSPIPDYACCESHKETTDSNSTETLSTLSSNGNSILIYEKQCLLYFFLFFVFLFFIF